MEYTRIYGGDDGLSYFEQVTVPLGEILTPTGVTVGKWTSWPLGDRLQLSRVNPRSGDAADPTAEGDGWGPWHPEARPEFRIGLTGELEIECSGGGTRVFGPGSLLLVEDVTGKGHRNRRLTSEMSSIFIPVFPDAGDADG